MSLSEVYGLVVHKCGIDPNYFFDEMTEKEVAALSHAYFDEFKNGWERTRSTNHAIISSQSTKPVKLEEVLPLPWDNESSEKRGSKPDEKDMERLRKRANKI